jgi:hypothetical protein
MADVLSLVHELRGAGGRPAQRRGPSIEEEASYVSEFLDPLEQQILAMRADLEEDPILRQGLPLIAALRAAIVTLEGVLRSTP